VVVYASRSNSCGRIVGCCVGQAIECTAPAQARLFGGWSCLSPLVIDTAVSVW
jgi:hypothetical protein